MTKHEQLLKQFHDDPDAFRARQKEIDAFGFLRATNALEKLQHHMSGYDLAEWFGAQLGEHLWVKFTQEHHRNVLSFMSKLSSEYRYFILHILMTEPRFQ